MTEEEKINNTINCDNATTNDTKCKEVDDDVVQQFKIIMIIVVIVLLAFLGFFVYNLIKCYLPKWRGKLHEEPRKANIESSETKEPGAQIEFGSVA